MGSYGVIPPDLAGSIVSSHYFLFDLDKSKVNPKYLDYITRFGHYEEFVRRFVKGTTNYADIRPSDVLQLTIPLPSLEDQARIVEEIDRQVTIKEDAEKTLASLEVAAIDDHFFKSAKTRKLPEVAEINPTYKLTANSSRLFVEMAAIDELRGRVSYFKDKKGSSSGLSRFRDNDILFGRITPCTENGKVAVCEGLGRETGVGSTEFVVISPKRGINPKWLYFYLKTYMVRKQAKRSMIGTTGRQRVPNEFFEGLDIPILPLEKQETQAKELQGYIEVKDGLTKAIRLSQAAIENIVRDIFKIGQRTTASNPPTRMDSYLK
jgi:type I restriction enzyme S subunit